MPGLVDHDVDLEVGRHLRAFGNLEQVMGNLAARLVIPTCCPNEFRAAQVLVERMNAQAVADAIEILGVHRYSSDIDRQAVRRMARAFSTLAQFRNGVAHRPPILAMTPEGPQPSLLQSKGRTRKGRDNNPWAEISLDKIRQQTEEIVELTIEAVSFSNRLDREVPQYLELPHAPVAS